ncbi:hypothetical protein Bsp3421_004640 [Burkholderia sp. FERM BP-3421]|uniref:hypothetical protein n=1 Tax=Burkholderia sp. FERM BP-3421 TaxID=1494466 RepID=UPI002361F239|nr:hypothetical protein [Burkholderia sp. FERM BP-3421]WDD94512.1 hypothetical protein Bsp3421_004640 [Burkholderia sp. FERM BP-3421]
MILTLLTSVLALFIVLPGLRRTLDREGGHRSAQVRVFATFGHGIVRSGGAFYRFTLYESYLVTCFLIARAYTYRSIRVPERYVEKSGRLRLVINEVPVVLYGNSQDLEKFYKALSKFVELPIVGR